MRPRLLVARLWHEGNSFSPLRTCEADFRRTEWWRGSEVPPAARGAESELGAAVAWADLSPPHSVVFSRCAAASPGGPLAPGLFARIRDEIVVDVQAARPEAIYLSLHGALLVDEADGEPAPDLALLRAVREAAGRDAVIGVTLDLHANLHPGMAALAQIIVAYRSYPHVDMRQTGARVLGLIDAALRGTIEPRSAVLPLERLLPSHAMRTAAGPMAEVMEALRGWEQCEGGVLALSALGGFAYADVPHAGAAGLACVDAKRTSAAHWAGRVCGELASRVERFFVQLPQPAQAVDEALRRLAAGTTRPVALLDAADNPLSGGLGDTTALLQALLARPLPGETVFAFFHDPQLVERAAAVGVGATLDAAIGGRLLPAFGAPQAMTLRVERLTDGRFVNQGPMWAGQARALGPSVVFADPSRPLRIVVTSSCEAPNDPAWFALHGIELAALKLLGVKAKNHFRAAFAQAFDAMIDVDAPGLACLDLAALPFRHVPPKRLGYAEGQSART